MKTFFILFISVLFMPIPSLAAESAPVCFEQGSFKHGMAGEAEAENTYSLYPFSSQKESDRFQMLTKEIRCVVCQNQTIYDSEATLAADLRNKVYCLMLAKKSDDEIKNYLVKRYGEFILFKPRFKLSTFLLWLSPMICLILSLVFIFYYQKKSIPKVFSGRGTVANT